MQIPTRLTTKLPAQDPRNPCQLRIGKRDIYDIPFIRVSVT
uniref:Uncharacterized protein n=1 Tax=Arundo donax TaxID=35708 RepID=A0A0A9C431_ARUDO